MARIKSVLRRRMARSDVSVVDLAAAMNRPVSVLKGVLDGRKIQRSTAQKLLAALEKSTGESHSVDDFFESHEGGKVRVIEKIAPPEPKAAAEEPEGEGSEPAGG